MDEGSSKADLEFLEQKNHEAMLEAWNELNPLIGSEPTEGKRSLLEILDELFTQCIDVWPERFLASYTDLGLLTRCRKGQYYQAQDICPPTLEVAMANRIVNRWNPPGKRFLYLAHTHNKNAQIGDVTENEYTCLEEMRALAGEDYTFVDFMSKNSMTTRTILNLDYDDITQEGIDIAYDKLVHQIAMRDAAKIIPLYRIGMPPSKEMIAAMSKKQIEQLSAGCIGDSLLRLLCQTVFVPVDNDISLPEQREVAYKSFHTLADYLECKGINGIIYPSTRTKLVGKHTQNIVLFNADDFAPVPNSLRRVKKS